MSAQEQQYHYLRAELAELDKLLSMTAESAVIDRMSLEYRRSQVEAELEANPPPPRWPATAHLAFNGKPVVDRQGVYADFAGAAVDAFAKAVASLAASRQAVLGGRGVIPNRENYRLLVTGTSTVPSALKSRRCRSSKPVISRMNRRSHWPSDKPRALWSPWIATRKRSLRLSPTRTSGRLAT